MHRRARTEEPRRGLDEGRTSLVSIRVTRKDGLPAALQLIGPAHAEELLLATAVSIEATGRG